MARAVSQKQQDSANRLRYIRVLERFSKSIIGYFSKSEDLTHEAYNKKIDNNRRYLDRVESVQLYKGEFAELEKLVQTMISYKDSSEDMQEIQKEILYTANQLEKSLNAKRYKKDKHTSSKFNEWD
ncbi:MAG: hypothetical protein GQ570_06205 [Helicobacteraceae bacterium]|nr:hypothetical protein [Helicobacteraceae bacterium]